MLKHIKYFTLLPCLALLANNTAFAQTVKKERWFEVEVILFQQLGDKSLLKEQFPDDMPSAALSLRHKRFIELLTPFLKPDTSTLKLQLPLCGEKINTQDFFQQAATPTPFYQEKTLAEINNLLLDETPEETSVDEPEDEIKTVDFALSNNESDQFLPTINNEENLVNDNINEAFINPQINNLTHTTNVINTAEDIVEPLTPAIIALVEQAEQAFSPWQFNLSTDYFSVQNETKHRTKYQPNHAQLCQLSSQTLAQLSAQDSSFNANDFMVDKVPSTINAAGDVYSKKPYLLSKSSLKLNDIVKQLRWSKAFKPLLHLGWRLAPKGRNYAIPLHLFGGDNLQANYQNQLAQYNKAIASALEQEQEQQKSDNSEKTTYSSDQINAAPAHKIVLDQQQQYQQAVNNRIGEILAQLNDSKFTNDSTSPLNIDKLIADLDKDKLSLKINDKITQLEQKYHINKPQPPLQNWFLDGWFKVHLNHYLFITFDMTVLNKNLAEQASDVLKANQTSTLKTLEPLKLIEFKQDRRVISKEIHYFDNPYLGMIVQIRRHKRPAPPVEDEEQTDLNY